MYFFALKKGKNAVCLYERLLRKMDVFKFIGGYKLKCIFLHLKKEKMRFVCTRSKIRT